MALRRILRRRTVNDALRRLAYMDPGEIYESANSYFGMLRQATHSRRDRMRLAQVLFGRGRSVNWQLTKTYQSTTKETQ